MATHVTTKSKCCKSDPRCKNCPVVLHRLELKGKAQRTSKRSYVLGKVSAKTLKRARAH